MAQVLVDEKDIEELTESVLNTVKNNMQATTVLDSIQLTLNLRGVQTPAGTPTSEYADKIDQIGRTTILLHDWDDTLIGALSVPQGQHDIRALVNDYVRDRLIHPDLRNQSAAELASLDRIDTYRGEHPAEGPDGSLIREDGADYPLTNKLEYVFYGKTVDHNYPYVSGWVKVTPETMADTWTTLEAGQIITGYDFAAGVTEDVLHVKAAYKPGTDIGAAGNASNYTFSDFSFTRDGADDRVKTTFATNRINDSGRGVTRLKELGLRISPEISGTTWHRLAVFAGADEELLTVLLPSVFTSYSWAVVDISSSQFVTAMSMRSATIKLYPATPSTPPGFGDGWTIEALLKYYINDPTSNMATTAIDNLNSGIASLGSWAVSFGAQQVTKLGLDNYVNNIANQNTPGTTALHYRNTAKNRIILYKAAKGNRDITYPELIESVGIDTQMTLAYTVTADYLAFRVQTMMRAYELNGGDLTVPQMLALIAALNIKGAILTDDEIRTYL